MALLFLGNWSPVGLSEGSFCAALEFEWGLMQPGVRGLQ